MKAWHIGIAFIVTITFVIGIIIHQTLSKEEIEPKITYVMPKPNPERQKILKKATTPPRELYPYKKESTEIESEVSDTEVPDEPISLLTDDANSLEVALETEKDHHESKEVEVSPFGFGEFPDKGSFPESVIWESDIQAEINEWGSTHIKEVELMDRVLVKLWSQGHNVTSANSQRGLIYPDYPNTVYLELEYATDPEGNRFVSKGSLSGYQGITESEVDMLMEGVIPPGITVLSFDDGIDPYDFLNLD